MDLPKEKIPIVVIPKPRNMQMVVTKASLHAPKQDTAYWRNQPYADRLNALESIRQQYHLWKYGAEPRFQRVCTVVNR
jgi:hypothetical protein